MQDLIDEVLDLSPRKATRMWPMAFGFAVEAGRNFVTSQDIRATLELLEQSAQSRHRMGFLSDRRGNR